MRLLLELYVSDERMKFILKLFYHRHRKNDIVKGLQELYPSLVG